MARAKADPENQSIRVNVGVNKECVEKIDELIEASRVFNSRSEFIIAALRSLCFKYAHVSGTMLEKAKERHAEPGLVMEDYVRSMNVIGLTLEGRFRERFGKTVTLQIAIRLNPGFYGKAVGMDVLSPTGIQSLARMAIVDYCQEIESEIETVDRVFEETGKLSKSGPTEEDTENALALWDEITSGSASRP